MEKYYIYKHTAPNGKSYIGITSREPEVRWANGNGYCGQSKFYNAIKKYGWDNIEHEILFSDLPRDLACQREKEHIRQFDTINNGYNCSTGGEYGNEGNRKYKIGDKIGSFEIIGFGDVKFTLKCLSCGRIIERYNSSLKSGCVKCKCQIKYNPNPQPMNYCYITHNGKTQKISEWSKELGIPKGTIRARYKAGKPIDVAIHDPALVIACENCGKMFHPRAKSQKYCSRECGDAGGHLKLRAKRESTSCAYCGNEFVLKRARDNDYKGIYCSIQCRINHQKQMKQEGSTA